MAELMPFQYGAHTFAVRLDPSGEPWFLGVPTAELLGYANPRQAIGRLEPDEKGVYSVDSPGGKQETLFVNEAGLYSLILRSKKAEAKAFKRWITHEVLPTLRRSGRYEAPTLHPPRIDQRHSELDYLRAHHDFLANLGMLDDRDKLMLADCARNLLETPTALLSTAPEAQGWFVAERVRALGYLLNRKQEAAFVGPIAKKVAAQYRTRYGEEPPKRARYVDGSLRYVNYYPAKESAWMDAMIQAFLAGFPGLPAAGMRGEVEP
jgi:prophage antirepressor-like protein